MRCLQLGFLTLCLLGCGMRGEDMPRQEVVERIRALGIKPSAPVFTLPSNKNGVSFADVTLYAASPFDDDATVEAWTPTSRVPGAFILPSSAVTLTSSVMTREKKGALYIHTAPVRVLLPFLPHGAPIGFGLKVRSHGKTESIIASVLAYPAGSAELSWTAPTLRVAAPPAGKTLKVDEDNKLSLTASATQDEEFVAGWFVSSGEIYNRTNRETYWKPSRKGSATVIATVRGRESLAFEISVLEVEVD